MGQAHTNRNHPPTGGWAVRVDLQKTHDVDLLPLPEKILARAGSRTPACIVTEALNYRFTGPVRWGFP